MSPEKAYHVTPSCNSDDILRDGISGGSSFWSREDLVRYFCAEISREGQEPVVFSVPIHDLFTFAGRSSLSPDPSALYAPVSEVIGADEDDVLTAWAASSGGWEKSSEIVGSFVCDVTVPGRMLSIEPPEPFMDGEDMTP